MDCKFLENNVSRIKLFFFRKGLMTQSLLRKEKKKNTKNICIEWV
jgi:hypothetical protein